MSGTSEPRKLGKFLIGPTIGVGGFSKVKLGTHESTGQKVALKLLKKNKLNVNSSTRKQVEREINAMSKIEHRNVIRLIDCQWDCVYPKKHGKKEDVILIVLELATGGELFEFLAHTGCFEEAIARTYFHQLIAGIEHCHSKGVAHRDLKPENLLLDDQFVLKLADFGLSNIVSSSSDLMYTECGTPGYMAPEMFKNRGYDAVGADIWACGVILFIMLAGFPPFQKPNVTDWWFHKLANNKHALFWQAHSRNAYFSDQIKDFVNKILTVESSKRITVADIKKHPWFTGTTIKDDALFKELQRRKTEVDRAKIQDRLDKKKEQENVPMQMGGGGVNAVTVRSLGEEGLPSCPPSFRYRGAKVEAKIGESKGFSGGSLSMGDSAFGGYDMMGDGEVKQATAPVFDASENTACHTRFHSNKAPAQVLNRIGKAFASMQGQYSVKKNEFKAKANLSTQEGTVTVTAQVYANPSNPNQSIVDFRRRQGDAMQYHGLYMDVLNHLVDIIIPSVSTPSESASSTKEAEPLGA